MQLWGFENRSSQFQPAGSRFGLMQTGSVSAIPITSSTTSTSTNDQTPLITPGDHDWLNNTFGQYGVHLPAMGNFTRENLNAALTSAGRVVDRFPDDQRDGLYARLGALRNGRTVTDSRPEPVQAAEDEDAEGIRTSGHNAIPQSTAEQQLRQVVEARSAELIESRAPDYSRLQDAYVGRGGSLTIEYLSDTAAYRRAIDGLTQNLPENIDPNTRGRLERLQSELRSNEAGRAGLADALTSTDISHLNRSTASNDDYTSASQRLAAVPRLSGSSRAAASGDTEAPQRPEGRDSGAATAAGVAGGVLGGFGTVVAGLVGLGAVSVASYNNMASRVRTEANRVVGMVAAAVSGQQAQAQIAGLNAMAAMSTAGSEAHALRWASALNGAHLRNSPGTALAAMTAEVGGTGVSVSSRNGAVGPMRA